MDKQRPEFRCKENEKEGLWVLARKPNSYSNFLYEYFHEADYINSLSDSEKVWLNDFFRAYYFRDKKSMDKLGFSVEVRRDRYNRHRGTINDVFTKGIQVPFSATTYKSSYFQELYAIEDEEVASG